MKDNIGVQDGNLVKLYVKGFLYSFGLALILILLLTTVFFFIDINTNFIDPLEFIILLMSVIYASIYISKKMDSKGWLHGIIVGVIYYLFFLIINLIITPDTINLMVALPRSIFFVSTGFIGGCIGINIR